MTRIPMLLLLLATTAVPTWARVWVGVPACPRPWLDDALRNVSDPLHPQFGQYLTHGAIAARCGGSDTAPDARLATCTRTGYGDAYWCPTVPATVPPGSLVVTMDGGRSTPRRHPHVVGASDAAVAPEVYRAQYGVPDTVSTRPLVGVVEFQGDASFSWDDLRQFCATMGIAPCPRNATVVGPFHDLDTEATLDVQTVVGAMPRGGRLFYGTYANWLLEFTASFATRLAHGAPVPDVVSISWGWREDRQCDIAGCNDSRAYVDRVNEELLKLALQGVTVVASSGDAGAAGRTDEACQDPAPHAAFPASSPYVLSVGGTVLTGPPRAAPTSPFCAQEPCVGTPAREDVAAFPGVGWTSGGGFSAWQPRLPHQRDVVAAYVAAHPCPGANTTGTRAYPDLAAAAHAVAIVLGGQVTLVDGTSASAPLVAGLLGHAVAETGARLGLVAPALYAGGTFVRPGSANSSNACTEETCQGCAGFTADPTLPWDPVFGLGTPRLLNLNDIVQQ